MTHPHASKANLNANDAHTLCSQHLQNFLELNMKDRHYAVQDILDVLLTAANQNSTIDAVSGKSLGHPGLLPIQWRFKNSSV